jgi:hypothetical protein
LSSRLKNQLVVFTFLSSLAFPAVSQVNNPAYADYLLVGQFGEICTMCEAVVLCKATDRNAPYEDIPEHGSFTIYHLQTRTFWSQIATIWEWFIANFDSDSLATPVTRVRSRFTLSPVVNGPDRKPSQPMSPLIPRLL